MRMKNTLIYLFGFSGTGKYTIAKEIAARTDALLIDNHLINNPIFTIIRADGKSELPEAVSDCTRRIGDIVREAMVTLAAPDENFILTNAMGENEEDKSDYDLYYRILDIAVRREATFVPVRLLCDLDELKNRITSADRRERLKLTDVDAITDLYNIYTVLNPDHPCKFELDVTHLTAQKAATAILAHVENLAGTG